MTGNLRSGLWPAGSFEQFQCCSARYPVLPSIPRIRGLIWLISALLLIVSPAHSQPLNPHSKIENAAFPIYLDFAPEPAAVIYAKKISIDHQRKGFFRIGLLPILACDGVKIEIHDSKRITDALTGVSDFLEKRRAGKAVELRQVSLIFSGEPAPRLEAELVRPRDGAHWLLSKATYRTPTNSLCLREAALDLLGEHAGRLSWKGSQGPEAANIFSSSDISTSNPIQNKPAGETPSPALTASRAPGGIPALRPPATTSPQNQTQNKNP